MRFPKRYGQSQVSTCPFCGGAAYAKNADGVPVCTKHTASRLPDLKCACGGWLDQRESKFGVFYTCMKCGPVSFSRMLEVNAERIRAPPAAVAPVKTMTTPSRVESQRQQVQEKIRAGIPLRPDELEYL